MYTNRIDTAGNPIYEEMNSENNSSEFVFCPYCGISNYFDIDWCGIIKGIQSCDVCGGQWRINVVLI